MIPNVCWQPITPVANDEVIPRTIVRHVYGLPPSWIRQLGRPDQIKPHPRHLGKTIALYSRCRVEALIEARQPAYLQMLIRRAKQYRRYTAETCRQAHDLIAWARTVEIVVAALPQTVAQLEQETTASFLLNCAGENGDPFVLTPKAMVAHVRHTCTNYHQLLNRLQRGPGTTVAYLILKRRVNQVVRKTLRQQYGTSLAEAYP